MGFAVLYPSYSGYSGSDPFSLFDIHPSTVAFMTVVGWVEAIAETHHIHLSLGAGFGSCYSFYLSPNSRISIHASSDTCSKFDYREFAR
jgi:hypothetical protein